MQLASANPASPDNWLHEVFRVARPMGPLSPHTDLLAGVLQPWLRSGISAEFVERLIAELRGHYQYVLLDLGDEPLGEATREAAVSAAALRAADQILVVCSPDAAGLHQTYMALAQAGPLVDRERAGLVVNRYEPRYHQANVAAGIRPGRAGDLAGRLGQVERGCRHPRRAAPTSTRPPPGDLVKG